MPNEAAKNTRISSVEDLSKDLSVTHVCQDRHVEIKLQSVANTVADKKVPELVANVVADTHELVENRFQVRDNTVIV